MAKEKKLEEAFTSMEKALGQRHYKRGALWREGRKS